MDWNNEKISLIIPIYNVEEYLSRCLDSVLKQTYPDFGIILIDDGSSDNSGIICDEYAKKDNRIRVFHVPNGGVSKARNIGLSHVRGEWFGYVDADDWVEPDFLQKLYEMALEERCDVVACHYQRDNEFCSVNDVSEERHYVFNGSEECVRNFILNKNSMNGMVWNKLYRSAVFRDDSFDTSLKVNEDCLYTFHIMQKCHKACLSSRILYHWFQRENGACHSKPQKIELSAADVFLTLLRDTENLNDNEVVNELQANYERIASHILFFTKHKRKERAVQDALKRIRIWRKNTWKRLDVNHRVKVVVVLYFPFLLPLLRRVFR